MHVLFSRLYSTVTSQIAANPHNFYMRERKGFPDKLGKIAREYPFTKITQLNHHNDLMIFVVYFCIIG
jgi:hypothetical protein